MSARWIGPNCAPPTVIFLVMILPQNLACRGASVGGAAVAAKGAVTRRMAAATAWRRDAIVADMVGQQQDEATVEGGALFVGEILVGRDQAFVKPIRVPEYSVP